MAQNDFNLKVGVEAQVDEKKVQSQINNQSKNVKLKANVEVNADKVYKNAQKQLKTLYDLQKQYAKIESPTKDEVYYYEQAIKKAKELYTIARSKTSEPDVYNFQKRNELELKAIQYERQLSSILDKQTKNSLAERMTAETKIQAELKQTAKLTQDSLNLKSNKVVLNNQISTYLRENSKLSTSLKSKLIDIQKQVQSVDKTGLQNLKNQFREVTTEANALGRSGKNTFDEFKSNIKGFLTFVIGGGGVMMVVNSFRELISTVSDLDKSIVDLRQATGITQQQAQKLLDTYIQMGQQLGATGKEVADAASSWLKQGKSIKETNTLIRDSMILSKIGSIESANSTKYLTAITKAYGISVEDTLKVVDKLSAVDMASATDVSGLSEAVSSVSANAQSVGISLDKVLGYVATIGEVSGEAMSSVGNSISTMLSRMANIKLSRLTDPETGEDLSNVETSLRNVGIEIREDDKTFKNFGDVLDDVASNWNSYSDVTKRSIASSIAGKDHMNDFLILLNSYDTALKYTTVSTESSGEAMEKFASYEDGVEFKTKRLQASFEELASDTLNSGVMKSFLDLSNGLINTADSVGIFNIALVALSGVLGSKLLTLFPSFANNLAITIADMGVAQDSAIALGGALSTMLPVAGILLGITALSKAYDYFNVTVEETEARISELQTSYAELQSEYDTLSQKQQLTTYESDRLKYLERRLELDKQILDIETKKQYQNLVGTSWSDGLDKDSLVYKKNTESNYRDSGSYLNLSKDTSSTLSDLKETNELIAQLEEEQKSLNKDSETYYFNQESINGLIKDQGKDYAKLSDYQDDLVTKQGLFLEYANQADEAISSGLLEGKDLTQAQEMSTYWHGLYDEITNTLNTIGQVAPNLTQKSTSAINEITDSATEASNAVSSIFSDEDIAKKTDAFQSDIDSIKYALDSLASGKLNSSSIVDLMQQFSSFDWSKYGVTGKKGMGDLQNALQDLAQESLNMATTSIPQLRDAFTDMFNNTFNGKSYIDGLINDLDDLNSILTRVKNGEKLSAEEVSKLIANNESLAGAVVVTADGYTIEENALKSLINTQSEDANKAIVAQIDKTNTIIEQTKKNIDAYIAEAQALDILASAYSNAMNPINSMEDYLNQNGRGTANKQFGEQNIDNYIGYLGNTQTLDENIKKLEGLKGQLTTSSKYNTTTDSSSKSSSSGSSGDPYLDKYNADKDTLDHKLAMDEISEKTYYDKLEKLNDKYFKNHKKKYLKQYRQNQEEIYDGRKALADKTVQSYFDDNKQDFDMGEITEEEYYKQLKNLNDKYYKNNADKQDEYKANLVTLHNWEVEQAKEVAAKKLEAEQKHIDGVISKYEESLSNIDDLASNSEDGSNEQFSAYTEGLKTAGDEVSYLETQITKLNKKYKDGKISEEDYTSQLENLTSQLGDAKDAMESYQQSLTDSIQAQLETQTDAITEAYETEKDAIEDRYDAELESINTIIDAKKKSLEADKEADEYAEDIADKTDALSKIDNRIAELSKAAKSGDREAQSELDQLQEDRDKAQKDLDKSQADHKLKVEEDALDKSLDNYKTLSEKNKATDLANAKTVYDSKIADITDLYKKEEELITHASEYTKKEFTAAFKDINTQLSTYGISGSDVNVGDLYNNLTDTNDNNTQSATDSAILSILSNGTGKGDGTSALNKYVTSNYGHQLSYDQMASIASLLGIKGVTAKNIINDTETKNEILKKLKAASFSTGGYASGSLSDLIKQTGEDGISLLKRGEPVLTVEQGKLFKELVNRLPQLNSLVKIATPNISNLVTNNNSSPIFNFDNMIQINGNLSGSDAAIKVKSAGDDIIKKLYNVMRTK